MTDEKLPSEEKELLAVVDIGSNSVRMNIYDIDTKSGKFTTVSSSRSMLKLASYVTNGILSPDGEGKLFALIREYLAKANSMPCDKFTAFATASLRGVSNAQSVIERIKKKLGVTISVISGQDEARFDYIATCERFKSGMAQRGIVIDMGGGSTELIAFDEGHVHHSYSLDIGSLGLWKSFCGSRRESPFPNAEERENIVAYVKKELKKAEPLESFGGTAYLIGGTARALSKIDAFLTDRTEQPDGYKLDDLRFNQIANAVIKNSEEDGDMLKDLCADRITSIVPGIIAYRTVLESIGVSHAIVSLAGVREGYLEDYINKTFRREFQEF